MDMIGKDPQLYTMFIQMVRIVFETTPYPSLSSLRVDVLMKFHDLDVEEVPPEGLKIWISLLIEK
jgi:hypothetical protein